MLPSIFGENLFDEFFDDDFEKNFFGRRNPLYGRHAKNLMKTDVREVSDGYELDIDLPGFKKEEVAVDLQNGYLTVSAAKKKKRRRAATSAASAPWVPAAEASTWAMCAWKM